MNIKLLRERINAQCDAYPSAYAQLVKPINDMLLEIDAAITEETAQKIVDNLQQFAEGAKYMPDCHLDESDHFLADGIEALKKGHLADGALQIFGAGLNFASFSAKAINVKQINPYELLDEQFKQLKSHLQE